MLNASPRISGRTAICIGSRDDRGRRFFIQLFLNTTRHISPELRINMPSIPQFPADLGDLHHAWHEPSAHRDLPTRLHPMGSRGGGAEFLTFHRDFMVIALDWYNHHVFTEDPFTDPGQKASLVAPWGVVPAEM